jgi:anaerobic ribonucleoside-triphosphate reductase activating protein
LQQHNYGDPLLESFTDILQLYLNYAECVCFLGEGANTSAEQEEFQKMVRIIQKHHLKTCLYSGRDTEIEEWMKIFDFIKLGSYREEFGGLDSITTNQMFFEKYENGYVNQTHLFWQSDECNDISQ